LPVGGPGHHWSRAVPRAPPRDQLLANCPGCAPSAIPLPYAGGIPRLVPAPDPRPGVCCKGSHSRKASLLSRRCYSSASGYRLRRRVRRKPRRPRQRRCRGLTTTEWCRPSPDRPLSDPSTRRRRNRFPIRSSCRSADPVGEPTSDPPGEAPPTQAPHHPDCLAHDFLGHLAYSLGPIDEDDWNLNEAVTPLPCSKGHLDLKRVTV